MNNNTSTISERIRMLRARAQLSQDAVADACHVSQGLVGKWERGASTPSATEIAHLCDLFDVPADFLVGRSDSMQALPPDSWLVDLDYVDAVRNGTLDTEHGDIGAVAIPRRAKLMSSAEYAQLSRELLPLLRDQRRGRK